MTPSKKTLLPVVVLVLGAASSVGLIATRPGVATRTAERAVPLVEVSEVRLRPERIVVEAQGTVAPSTESELVAEVSGRIVWVSPGLASGGFVEAGDALLRIDRSDYEVAAERAEAGLERARSEHDVAVSQLERVKKLARNGVASPSRLDDARHAERVAHAALRDARAARTQARRDLERTEVTSPFAGRVREKYVDVGQFVARGARVARVYAVDYAEVRLPLTDEDAAFLDLPIDYRGDAEAADGPAVTLSARFAGRRHIWTGRIVRTEGEIDPRTRMIHAVARVENPYGRGDDPDRPPLAVGLYVDAEIQGRVLEGAISIPRSALRGRDQVVVVDSDERLRTRRVEILRRGEQRVLVTAGLAEGDRVCRTPLSLSLDGSLVRVAPVAPAAEGEDEPALATAGSPP